jgi:hypothetical protein
MIIGYARVSTEDQNLDGQLDALKAAGAEKIFADKITGTARSRPELDRLLDQLRQGDVITVTKYDRLARSLRDLLDIVDTIQAHGAGFRSLAEDIDTTTPAGRWCSMSSPPSPSLSGSGFRRGQKKGWKLRGSVDGWAAGPLPYQPRRRLRCGGCATRS